MADYRIKFSELRELLAELGFRQVPISREHVGFQRDNSDTFLAIPVYKDRELVAPRHVIAVRVMLENAGLLSGEEFDRRWGAEVVKPSAS
jgi:hypothetical protein